MSDAFPNMFFTAGPLSPGGFFSPPLQSDYQVQLIARIIDQLSEQGVREIEPEPAAVEAWMAQVDTIYHMTLLPKAASWWSGANIPGKPRQFLYFLAASPPTGICARTRWSEGSRAICGTAALPRRGGRARPAVPTGAARRASPTFTWPPSRTHDGRFGLRPDLPAACPARDGRLSFRATDLVVLPLGPSMSGWSTS